MSNQANQCPKCKKYILGDYCFLCNESIPENSELGNLFKNNPVDNNLNPFKDIFNN